MSDGPTQADLDEWAQIATTLNLNVTRGPTEANLAGKAAPLIWSEYGSMHLPRAIQVLITEAIEAGYAQALSDIQDGDLDGEIRIWRPGLTEG